jgi:isoquinoline 1-oxidoreductase beta subunit
MVHEDDYEWVTAALAEPMRIDEVPVIEIHLIKSAELPGGIGEAPTAAVGPAVANAIFAATGKRIRTLPIDTDLLKAAG